MLYLRAKLPVVKMSKAKIGIVNVTGYTGMELARLLANHPQVELTAVTGRSTTGKKLADVLPFLTGLDLTIESELGGVDVSFTTLPHKESVLQVEALIKRGIKVIDISADYRLKDTSLYPKWYGYEHPFPSLLKEAVYGLPELHRGKIQGSRLVANPGCYPTGAILALAPVLKMGLVGNDIVIDSKSGISGAGRTLDITSHYAEANENSTAYAMERHRHLPEMEQELTAFGGELVLTFVPHLVPMTRGILTTTYADLKEGIDTIELIELYKNFYAADPFIKVVSKPPYSKHVTGSNYCHIHPTVNERTGKLVVLSAIDNLVKGAAGQAIQNMNLMLGLEETTGLESYTIYP